MNHVSSARRGIVVGSLLAAVLAWGCAPLPPMEPPVRQARRTAPPTPYAGFPAERQLNRGPTPTPTRGGYVIEEQEVGESVSIQPDLPPPDLVIDDESDVSLAPQIKSAKAPNVAAALRIVDEGRILINQKRYDQALEKLQRAVSIDPSSFYGYYYLAKAHQATHSYSQAVAFANRATALGAQGERVWLGRAFALQGAIFEEVGRFPDARMAYQRAVEADPTNLAAYVGKARLSPRQSPPPSNNEDPRR